MPSNQDATSRYGCRTPHARTFLVAWLAARSRGGRLVYRVEDLDTGRVRDESIDAAMDDLRWLGLDWDGEAVFQFSRAVRHAEVAHELVARGHAYRCYMTPEELAAPRAGERGKLGVA